jgi:hypothetical protein
VLGACGGSLSPQRLQVIWWGQATQLYSHGTFLHPPCCHTRRPWGDPVGAQQAAAPLGEVSRSAGSLWGQSEPTGFNAYGGGRVAAVHMEPFSTHPAATPGGPGATLWGHSRQQPL